MTYEHKTSDRLPESAGHLQNDARTCEQIDTSLTQMRSPGVPGYVYFIKGDDAIKIGYSIDPAKRLAELQNASCHHLELLGAIEGSKATESYLHDRFRHIQKIGEWFYDDSELLAFIDHALGKTVVEEPGPPLSPEAAAAVGQLLCLARTLPADQGGQIAYNLIEMIENDVMSMKPWGDHPLQQPAHLFRVQLEGLERALKSKAA